MNYELVCDHCLGTGKHISTPEVACPFCFGTGRITTERLEAGYYHSADIFECINNSEYQDLADNKKDFLGLMLSSGHVNMNAGSNARTKLANYFPSGTTHDCLSNLLGEPL